MDDNKVIHGVLCCPSCEGGLEYSNNEGYRCVMCGRFFPIRYGIADFRLPRLKDRNIEDDNQRAARLFRKYEDMDFRQLIEYRYEGSKLPKNMLEANITVRRSALKEGKKYDEINSKILGRILPDFKCKISADIGCGIGGYAVALASRCDTVYGVDISLEELVLARKLVSMLDVRNVTYICASAEHLPFRKHSVDFITAMEVLEHVQDQEGMIRETNRALKRGGILIGATPNRYNIFSPEPHVNLWFLGFLPRKYMNAYTKRRIGVEYLYKRNLSYLEIRKLMKSCSMKYWIFPLFDQSRHKVFSFLIDFVPFRTLLSIFSKRFHFVNINVTPENPRA